MTHGLELKVGNVGARGCAGRRRGENGGKVTGNKKHKWQVQNRQEEVKNSMGNAEVKELTCMTHGHELRYRNDGEKWGQRVEGNKGEKNRTNVIAQSIKYT